MKANFKVNFKGQINFKDGSVSLFDNQKEFSDTLLKRADDIVSYEVKIDSEDFSDSEQDSSPSSITDGVEPSEYYKNLNSENQSTTYNDLKESQLIVDKLDCEAAKERAAADERWSKIIDELDEFIKLDKKACASEESLNKAKDQLRDIERQLKSDCLKTKAAHPSKSLYMPKYESKEEFTEKKEDKTSPKKLIDYLLNDCLDYLYGDE